MFWLDTPFKWVQWLAALASIGGLIVSLWTLYLVQRLPVALRRQVRHAKLHPIVEEIEQLQRGKRKLTQGLVEKAAFFIATVERYEISNLPWKHRAVKQTLAELKREIRSPDGLKRVDHVRLRLRQIYDEISVS